MEIAQDAELRILFLCIIITFVDSTHKLDIILSPDYIVTENDVKDCYHVTNPTLTGMCLRVKENEKFKQYLRQFPRFKGRRQDVSVSVNIMDIDQINENNMEFRLHCYLAIVWKNENINFTVKNPKQPFVLPPLLFECMWKPDVIFPNTKEIMTFKDTVPNSGYKYLPEGTIYRVERYIMRISCPMMFNLYPMDTQHCVFKIALVSNPDELVKLNWHNHSNDQVGVFYQYKIHPLQFSIEDPIPFTKTEAWVTGSYTELWANITLHRRMTGNIINFYIPSTLVVFLSWLSFYIDVTAAPARVTLGVTALLTITTQMVQARNILPPVQYITAIDIWLFVCLTIVFASFIEYSIAYTFQTNLKQISPYPVQKLDITKNVTGRPPTSKTVAFEHQQRFIQQPKPIPVSYNKLDRHSRWVFPSFMAVFAVIYWSYYLCVTEIPLNSQER